MKVSELKDEMLDYWAARAGEVWKTAHEMYPTWTLDSTFKGVEIWGGKCFLVPSNPMRQDPKIYSPSTDWSQGGPIIERERIAARPPSRVYFVWHASIDNSFLGIMPGETPLIAAMRCYVASKFGEEV